MNRTEKKKAQILTRSIELLIQTGFKKTTMDDIAKYARASKVTIYKYFGDKESFYKVLVQSLVNDFNADIDAFIDSNVLTTYKMIQFTERYTQFINLGKLSLIKDLAEFNDEVAEIYESFKEQVRQLIRNLIIKAQSEGLIEADKNVDVVYHYIDMGFDYFQNNIIYRKKIMNDAEFSKEFMQFIWSNIFTDVRIFSTELREGKTHTKESKPNG